MHFLKLNLPILKIILLFSFKIIYIFRYCWTLRQLNVLQHQELITSLTFCECLRFWRFIFTDQPATQLATSLQKQNERKWQEHDRNKNYNIWKKIKRSWNVELVMFQRLEKNDQLICEVTRNTYHLPFCSKNAFYEIRMSFWWVRQVVKQPFFGRGFRKFITGLWRTSVHTSLFSFHDLTRFSSFRDWQLIARERHPNPQDPIQEFLYLRKKQVS